MKSFLLMITFFTRFPIKYPYDFKEENFKKGIIYLPIIGLLIGVALWIISQLGIYFDRPVLVIIIWLFYLWITGGLHLDGLADSCDGLLSNRERDKMLEIMRDSRIGTFGVLGILFITLSNLILTLYLGNFILIIFPMVGRSSALLSGRISKYARKGDGMGRAFMEGCRNYRVLSGIAFTLIIAIIIQLRMVPVLIITYVIVVVLTGCIKKKIGGMTGDTVGAIIELSQTIFLFFSYLLRGLIL